MDQRQQKVQVGAGLQESRLNTEFIAFLEKYGTRALYIILVVVLAYVGWQRWTRWQAAKLDQAFVALNAAMESRNPDNLMRVSADHRGQGSVWIVANLAAADQYLDAVRRGLAPGANLFTPAETDRLTETQQQEMLVRANGILQEVIDSVGTSKGHVLFAQAARWGLVTVAIANNDEAKARKLLNEYIDTADTAGLKAQAEIGRARLNALPGFLAPKAVYAEAELPASARPFRPASPFSVQGGTGQEMSLSMEELQELLRTSMPAAVPDTGEEDLPPPTLEELTPPPPPPASQPAPGNDGG